MNVRWMAAALQDRYDVVDYIAADNPTAAERMDAVFDSACDLLSEFPRAGRQGEIPGTREWIPHKSYRMVYEIEEDTIWILAVVHTAPNGLRSTSEMP